MKHKNKPSCRIHRRSVLSPSPIYKEYDVEGNQSEKFKHEEYVLQYYYLLLKKYVSLLKNYVSNLHMSKI